MSARRMIAFAPIVVSAAIAGAGCAAGGSLARPAPFPGGMAPPSRADPVADAGSRARAAAGAFSFLGTPYRLGGDHPAAGFDCSGLVRYVFLEQTIELPRTVAEQFRAGLNVEWRDIQTGDLVFFNTSEPGPSHVGIALDAATFVHAPGSGAVVRVDRFETKYWRERLAGIRRATVVARP